MLTATEMRQVTRARARLHERQVRHVRAGGTPHIWFCFCGRAWQCHTCQRRFRCWAVSTRIWKMLPRRAQKTKLCKRCFLDAMGCVDDRPMPPGVMKARRA